MQQLALPQNDLFSIKRLPNKPYCTNDYANGFRPRILPALKAIEFRHIQPNHPVIKFRLVFDLDRPTGCGLWSPLFVHEDAGLPPPNWVAINPESGNGHVGYELEVPVRMDDELRKAARYLAAIEQVYGIKLNADPSYSGHLCKNPLNPHWGTDWLTLTPYSLDDLAEFVNLSGIKFGTKKTVSNNECFSGMRNCTIFDELRKWAYKSVRQFWTPGGLDMFRAAALLKAEMLNCQLFFGNQLNHAEVKSIAKSVATWTWKKMSPDKFREFVAATHTPEMQSERGKKGNLKSVEVRSAKSSLRRSQAIKLASEQGMGIREIAREMDVSPGSVSSWLKNNNCQNSK